MKKQSLQVISSTYLLKEIGGLQLSGTTVSSYAASNTDGYWLEQGPDGNPNLCKEISETDPDLTAVVNDGIQDIPLTGKDFECCTDEQPCEGFVGCRPKAYDE